MKQILQFALVVLFAILISSCSSDDYEPSVKINHVEKEIAAVLNGKFIGSKQSLSDNIIEYQEITFTPYSEPVSEKWTEEGSHIDIEKDVVMFGECDVLKYYNDHLMEISSHWKYSINVSYDGAQPRLYFYPDFYGRYELHYITKKSPTSFELDGILFNKE